MFNLWFFGNGIERDWIKKHSGIRSDHYQMVCWNRLNTDLVANLAVHTTQSLGSSVNGSEVIIICKSQQ